MQRSQAAYPTMQSLVSTSRASQTADTQQTNVVAPVVVSFIISSSSSSSSSSSFFYFCINIYDTETTVLAAIPSFPHPHVMITHHHHQPPPGWSERLS